MIEGILTTPHQRGSESVNVLYQPLQMVPSFQRAQLQLRRQTIHLSIHNVHNIQIIHIIHNTISHFLIRYGGNLFRTLQKLCTQVT